MRDTELATRDVVREKIRNGSIMGYRNCGKKTLRELEANNDKMRAFQKSLIRIAPLLERASPGDYTNVDVTVTLTDEFQVPDLVDTTPDGEIPAPTLPPLNQLPSLGSLLGAEGPRERGRPRGMDGFVNGIAAALAGSRR